MKIVFTENNAGQRIAVCPGGDGMGEILSGDLASGWCLTGEQIRIRRILPAVEPVLIIGIAQNYREHADEMSGKVGAHPVFFIKLPHTLLAAGEPIRLPRALRSDKVDYEAELAVIIGRDCHNVSEADAMAYVAGYTAANDVTARDWQKEWGGGQFCRGKGFDTFCPIGPSMVTADTLADPHHLRIRGVLNGRTVQDGNTANMIYPIPKLIAFLSGSTTLPAGTVILTGTPAGVGAARVPPLFLQPGDRFDVVIDGLDTLSNPVIAEGEQL